MKTHIKIRCIAKQLEIFTFQLPPSALVCRMKWDLLAPLCCVAATTLNILTAYFVLQLVLTDTTCHIKYLLLCRSSKSGIHYLQGLSFFLEGEGKASLLAGRSVVFPTSTNTPKIKHWVNLKLLQLLQVTQQPQVAGKPITGSHLKPV